MRTLFPHLTNIWSILFPPDLRFQLQSFFSPFNFQKDILVIILFGLELFERRVRWRRDQVVNQELLVGKVYSKKAKRAEIFLLKPQNRWKWQLKKCHLRLTASRGEFFDQTTCEECFQTKLSSTNRLFTRPINQKSFLFVQWFFIFSSRGEKPKPPAKPPRLLQQQKSPVAVEPSTSSSCNLTCNSPSQPAKR